MFEYSILGEIGDIAPFSISKSQSSDVVVRGTIQLDGSLTSTGNSTGTQLGAVGASEKCYAAIHCYSVSGTSTPTITFKLQSDVIQVLQANCRIRFTNLWCRCRL